MLEVLIDMQLHLDRSMIMHGATQPALKPVHELLSSLCDA